MQDTIDHITFSRLVEAGAVRGAHIVGCPGGWAVRVKYGMHERTLAATRSGEVRLFKRFETLVNYLKGAGIARFDVDAADFDPTTIEAARRPDRSAALKQAHAAAAHDAWFRGQVLASLEDPRPSISDEEARAHFAAKRKEVRKQVGIA